MARYRHFASDRVSVVAPACLLLRSTHAATALSFSETRSPIALPGVLKRTGGFSVFPSDM